MLIYLDNAASVGPDSVRAAQRAASAGLNENLARECLELHTVSPAAGYTQADVTELRQVLTGWSMILRAEPPGFRFRPVAHEPGAQTVMGQLSAGPGRRQAVLRFLAGASGDPSFPGAQAGAAFRCRRSARRMRCARIEGVLRDTGGDLGAAAAALITLEAAWQPRRQAAHAAGLRDGQSCARWTCRTSSAAGDCRACSPGLASRS